MPYSANQVFFTTSTGSIFAITLIVIW